jgi:hypothetical protein
VVADDVVRAATAVPMMTPLGALASSDCRHRRAHVPNVDDAADPTSDVETALISAFGRPGTRTGQFSIERRVEGEHLPSKMAYRQAIEKIQVHIFRHHLAMAARSSRSRRLCAIKSGEWSAHRSRIMGGLP